MADITKPTVVINTSYGPVTVELYADKAPKTVANFLQYVDEGFYDGTIFHRVVKKFVIQGGGINTALEAKTTHAPITLEADTGLSNVRGTIAMARTSVADSATSQFYINTVDNVGLDKSATNAGYAVFGKVTDGLDVVDAISNAHTFSVTVSKTTTYPSLPFPFLSEILSAGRYNLSDSLTPTSYSSTPNAAGVTVITVNGVRADYGVKLNTNDTLSLTQLDGNHSSATISTTRARLHFSDVQTAYDIDGSAGKAAKMINAAFGYEHLSPDIVGIGIDLFDQGSTMADIAQLALNTGLWKEVAGGLDNTSFVNTVYTNVVGSAPDAATLAHFQGILDRHEMTQADMLVMAAETDANATFIDLAGLHYTGIDYL